MADRSIALYDFHGVFVHGVVKLSISNNTSCEREGNGSLLRDSAQAFSNVFFSQSKRVFFSNLLMSLQLRNIRFRQVYY